MSMYYAQKLPNLENEVVGGYFRDGYNLLRSEALVNPRFMHKFFCI